MLLLFKPAAPPSSTVVSVNNEIKLVFGLSREPISRSLRIDLCDTELARDFQECGQSSDPRPEVTSASLQSDLFSSSGSQFPATQVGLDASNVGTSGLLISVTANPYEPDDVGAGTYRGQAVVDRSDGSSVRLDIVSTLRSRSDVALGVLAALSLGALAGALIKWLDDSFGPVSLLRRHQRRVEQALSQFAGGLPLGVRQRLDDVRLAISTFDPAGVGATLEEIRSNQDALVEFASTVQELQRQIEVQRRLIDERGIETASGAVEVEQTFVGSLRRRNWPWEDAEKIRRELRKAEGHFRKLTLALRQASGNGDAESEQELKRVVESFVRGRTPVLHGVMSVTQVSRESSRPRRKARYGDFLGRHRESMDERFPRRTMSLVLLDNAWWLTLFVIAMVVVFAGYQTQFLEDQAFEGDHADYVQLAAWALAIQVAGGTVIETVGKMRTSRATS